METVPEGRSKLQRLQNLVGHILPFIDPVVDRSPGIIRAMTPQFFEVRAHRSGRISRTEPGHHQFIHAAEAPFYRTPPGVTFAPAPPDSTEK